MPITTPALRRTLLVTGLAGALVLTGVGTSGASVGAASSAPTTSAAAPAANTDDGKLLLMLDASGSMKEPDPSGGTKMQAAKKALTGVVDSLPDDADVGLRVYGATEEGGTPTKAACNDTQLAVPVGPLDKPAMKKAANGFRAKGETPIAHSLQKGLDDLGDTGKRNIILVSDGKESCVPDPCPTIKKLVGKGVDLRIDTVGFAVDDKARKQLECLADTGNGTYYDAADADELATSLNKISTRAVRDFSFSGQPVRGVEVDPDEQLPADLPVLKPGLYTDELTDRLAAGEGPQRAYSIKRTQKKSTLHVSFATKPSDYRAGDEPSGLETFDLEIIAQDGTECVSSHDGTGEYDQGLNPISTVTARLSGQSPDGDIPRACTKKGEFTVLVTRDGATQTTPTEIQVIEEPRVTNLGELPKAAEDYPAEKTLKAGRTRSITGGLSFADAPEITEGSWVDTLVPGETLVYRVWVEPGQTPRFTANGPTGGFRYPEGSELDSLFVDGRAFGPDRQALTDNTLITGNFSQTYGRSPKSVAGPPVRYRNRYADTHLRDNLGASNMGGWYYYAVGVGAGDLGQELAGQPIKVAFTVDLEGKPSGGPEYAGDEDWQAAAIGEKPDPSGPDGTSEEAGAADSDEDEGGSLLPWVGGGLLAALLLAAGAWFGIRRIRGNT
ncbi:vWA domain-containing protein [Janibacter corallicola]|uniref:vWA domain-containing protein n=1 Tax=Janibacter corallicola TaxID=415212 RepID=UPI00082DDB05|nr:VWA domain-containing protein [Janibacter corallicola]